MALRVDELELPSDGPIGPVRLSGLAQVDMVVITGPNGAGKTMLVRPLEKPGPSTGRVACIDAAGARTAFAVRGKGVEQSITFVTSADLMAKFRSLKEPLALAANVTREAHQEALLEQVASALRRQSVPAAEAEPAEIRVRRAAFLEADRRCGQAPRTLAEYDRLGQALASAAGKAWRCPPRSPDSARVAVESALQPEFRALAGLEQALPALKAVGAIAVPETGPSSKQAARADAEAKLAAALAAVATEVPAAAATAISAAPVDRVPLVRAALAEARSAVQRTIEADRFVRDLVNTPAQDMGPGELAAAAVAMAEELGMQWHGQRVVDLEGSHVLDAVIGEAADGVVPATAATMPPAARPAAATK